MWFEVKVEKKKSTTCHMTNWSQCNPEQDSIVFSISTPFLEHSQKKKKPHIFMNKNGEEKGQSFFFSLTSV